MNSPQEGEKRYRQALATFEKLGADLPDQPSSRAESGWACRNLARLLVRLPDRSHDALEMHTRDVSTFEKLAADFPDNPSWPEHVAHGHRERGFDLWDIKQPQEAEMSFREAIKVLETSSAKFPNAVPSYSALLADTYAVLARWLAAGGRQDEAERVLRQSLDILEKVASQPNKASSRALAGCYINVARALLATNQSGEATKAYGKALELAPRSAPIHNHLAWLLATCPEPKFRDPKRAVELANKAVELEPKDGNHWNTLGVAQYRAGDWKAAIAALEKSNELLKGNDLSFNAFFLAMAHWQLGNKDEARKWYDQAVGWMAKNKPQDEELSRFRAEAETLLKIETKPMVK